MSRKKQHDKITTRYGLFQGRLGEASDKEFSGGIMATEDSTCIMASSLIFNQTNLCNVALDKIPGSALDYWTSSSVV